MTKTWLVSDMHFGHHNLYTKFTDRRTGLPIRPWASNSDDGDEIIRTVWNERVAPNDKIYVLGDVAIPRRGLKAMEGLHGRKVLIRGNHDIFKMRDYAEYFEDILGSHKLDDTILTHYPIHPESIPLHWCRGVIHGHTHANMVVLEDGETLDRRFENVCIEYTDRGPVEWEEVRARFPQLGAFGNANTLG
jgi:calcineurin-like phosphoesterase family protein